MKIANPVDLFLKLLGNTFIKSRVSSDLVEVKKVNLLVIEWIFCTKNFRWFESGVARVRSRRRRSKSLKRCHQNKHCK